jgi:hypothetical protein
VVLGALGPEGGGRSWQGGPLPQAPSPNPVKVEPGQKKATKTSPFRVKAFVAWGWRELT